MFLVRWLLLAHPSTARRRYGDEIVVTIRTRVRRARERSGVIAALALWVRECAGVVSSGLEMRAARWRANRPPKPQRVRLGFIELVMHDVRIAVRGFVRQPAFALVAVAALSLGIGATVAIFSVFHTVVLSPLPFHEPSRLISIWEKNPERGWHQAQVAAANFLDWRAGSETVAEMAGYNDWLDERVLVDEGEPSVVLGSEVTGDFFRVLGVAPLIGRVFDDEHTWAGVVPAVVLSDAFWSRGFGQREDVVGRTLELGGTAHRVLGVMPPSFRYPFADADLWVPMAWERELVTQPRFRRAHGMRVVGRLAPGRSIDAARSELATIAERLERDYPETNRQMGTGATPLHDWIVGDAVRPLQILMAAVAFVLLIACANVSNMLLARASGREHELGIRSALGGGRRRLMLQGLVESVLLAIMGGIGGLVIGAAAIRPLLSLSPEGLPRLTEVGIDAGVVVFAISISVVTGVVLGILPAWRGAAAALSSSARGASSTRRVRRASGVLVALEVALTLPLVVGAGLMLQTLSRLAAVQPGFVADNVVVASLMAPSSRYEDDEQIAELYRRVLEEIRALPGVHTASLSSRLPFGNQRWSSDFTAESWPADRFGMGVRHDEIASGLFETMGVPLLRGRDFDFGDRLDAAPVVIINRALAETYFPDADPIGQRVTFSRTPDASSTWRTIVGVVGDVRRESLSVAEKPSFYAPVLQDTTRQLHVLMRSEQRPRALIANAQARIDGIDSTLPLFDVTTLAERLDASVGRERYLLILLTMAAVVALALAAVGIFGVVWYATTKRVREIGIRMALGARSTKVMALVIAGGLRPVIFGVAVGVVAAVAMARTMSSLLFEVDSLDPVTFGGVVLVVVVVAIVACVFPARWATRVDQTTALRAE